MSVFVICVETIYLLLHNLRDFNFDDFLVNVSKFAENCRSVTFTEEILNGKLHFLCSEFSLSIPMTLEF